MLSIHFRPRRIKATLELHLLQRHLWVRSICSLSGRDRNSQLQLLTVEQHKKINVLCLTDFHKHCTLPDHENFTNYLVQCMKKILVKMRNALSASFTHAFNLQPVFTGYENSILLLCRQNGPDLAGDISYEANSTKLLVSHRHHSIAPSKQIMTVSSDGNEQSTDTEKPGEKRPMSGIRLKALAEILHCSVAKVQELMEKHYFFNHMSPDLVESKVNLILSYGIPPSFIVEHPRPLYNTSYEQLSHRLQLLKENTFLEENSYSVLNKNLDYYLEMRRGEFLGAFQCLCEQRDALEGCSDRLAYLMFRLQCSEAVAKSLLDSYPLERKMSNVRLKLLLDFFLNEAMLSPNFVILYRKLLVFSVKRLRLRLRVMQKAGITSESSMVFIWCMSQKDFKQQYAMYLEVDSEPKTESDVS